MTDPSLALQTAVRSRLIADPAVTALVLASNIFDRSRRPEAFPCIALGDGQTVNEGITYARSFVRVFLDLHVWVKSEALADAKAITGPMEHALESNPAWTLDGGTVTDFRISHSRFMRDPGGELQHAVVTAEALIQRAPQ